MRNSLRYRLILLTLVLSAKSAAFPGPSDEDRSSYRNWIVSAEVCFAAGKYDSAKVFYERSLMETDPETDIVEYVGSKMGVANCEIRMGRIADAVRILKELEQIHELNKCVKCTHIGPIFSSLSYCSSINDDFPQSVQYAEKSIAANTEAFGIHHERTATSYYYLGLARKAMGNYPLAVEAFRQAIRIQSNVQNGLNRLHSNALMMLGTVYDDINRFDTALVYYDHSLRILRGMGMQVSMEAAANHIYSMSSLGHLSDIEGAVNHGETALEIYDSLRISEHANVASTCAKLAEIYFTSGDYDRSKKLLLHALEIYERRYPEKISAIGHYTLLYGDLMNRSGESSGAIATAEKGLKMYEKALGADHPQIGYRYETLARIYFDAERFGDALVYFRKALTVREKVNDSLVGMDIVGLNSSIGNVFRALQKYDSARFYFDRALSLERSVQVRNPSSSAVIRTQSGDLSAALGLLDEAISRYREALSLLTGSENIDAASFSQAALDKKEVIEILEKIAGLHERKYQRSGSLADLTAAQRNYLTAMELIDDLRRQYSSDASKFFLASHGSAVYRRGCSVSVQLYERTGAAEFLQQAFVIADRSKGNVLLDRLAENKARKDGMIPDSLLQTEQMLLERITYLETVLSRPTSTASAYTAQMEYFKANQQRRSLVDLFEKEYPLYHQRKYARNTLSVADIKRRLEQGEVLVEYMIDNDQIFLFALSQQSLTVKKVKGYQKIVLAARRFTGALKTFDTRSFWTSGAELYSQLIKPIRSVIGGASKLTIVPDGILHSIPFEALPVSGMSADRTDFSTADYLIERSDIAYAYSAAFRLTYGTTARELTGSSMSFAGFAPVFRDSSKGNELLANRSFAEQSGVSDVRSITLDGRKFNELKYSEDEVVSIGQRLSARSVSASTFLFSSATEHNFKLNAPTVDILHVATHGFINEQNPSLSAVIFSQPDQPGSDDDGILTVSETVNLNLKAQLVVLSSCESGVGQFVNGEGMIALSRGLLYAGAQNIVFSLWKVSDRQTYRLMDEFYGNIAEGKGFASSLRAAKLSMIRSKETAFPGKWSGFVLIGR